MLNHNASYEQAIYRSEVKFFHNTAWHCWHFPKSARATSQDSGKINSAPSMEYHHHDFT